jgi:hypothetical protein
MRKPPSKSARSKKKNVALFSDLKIGLVATFPLKELILVPPPPEITACVML